jgi:hypothetical protein
MCIRDRYNIMYKNIKKNKKIKILTFFIFFYKSIL